MDTVDADLLYDLLYDAMDSAVEGIVTCSPLEMETPMRQQLVPHGDPVTAVSTIEFGILGATKGTLQRIAMTVVGEDPEADYRKFSEYVLHFLDECRSFIKALWLGGGEKLRRKVLRMTEKHVAFEYKDLPAFPDLDAAAERMLDALGFKSNEKLEEEWPGMDMDDEEDENDEELAEVFDDLSVTPEALDVVESAESETALTREVGARVLQAAYSRSAN